MYSTSVNRACQSCDADILRCRPAVRLQVLPISAAPEVLESVASLRLASIPPKYIFDRANYRTIVQEKANSISRRSSGIAISVRNRRNFWGYQWRL